MNVKRVAASVLVLVIAACNSTPGGQPPADEGPDGAFGNGGKPKVDEAPRTTIVIDANDVGKFRGTTMAELLQTLEGEDAQQWAYVRRHVVPKPTAPTDFKDGKAVRANFAWPPEDPKNPTAQQRAWRSYLLWPAHIRDQLQSDNWQTVENRARLARYGRMYEVTWKFQQSPGARSEKGESAHWREYAETLIAYGKDGQEFLVSNMIVALTNPDYSMVKNAQSVLVQVGQPAIESLCAALWVGFRQASVLDDGTYVVQGNPNFNKYVIETLYRIGPRAVGPAIYELENSLDDNGQATGSAWRFRKHFVELLGKLGDAKALRALEAEITRVKVIEYEPEALKRGEQIVDKQGTDDATYLFHEHLIAAFGGIHDKEGVRGIIKLWELDSYHETAAIGAIRAITGKSVRGIDEARTLAKSLNVELK